MILLFISICPGDWFYEVDNYGVKDGYPVEISDHQRGFYPLTGPIDAAVYLNQTDELILFKVCYMLVLLSKSNIGCAAAYPRLPRVKGGRLIFW